MDRQRTHVLALILLDTSHRSLGVYSACNALSSVTKERMNGGPSINILSVDRGPQVLGETVRLLGGESHKLHPDSPPTVLDWLGQWLLGADLFIVYSSNMYDHE